ncbi:MAG: DEAD/DEAH box helicase family protein [Clostridia bacterium]|nr:DEAD/DEAH box helicase family protein [Clostridia bacterium]
MRKHRCTVETGAIVNSKARIQDRMYEFVKLVDRLDADEPVVICRAADGSLGACSKRQWDQSVVKPAEHASGPVSTESSVAEKIALFRSYFRGRTDVYAKRFFSAETGRSGYTPVCRNEWRKGVCDKKSTRCAACRNRQFVPLRSAALVEHLRGTDEYGRDVVGLYPLLADGSAYFLAADFDKTEWKLDAAAYRSACISLGLTPAVERSRSGQGAHVWLFFDTPIPAGKARQLGELLLHKAMDLRPELSFDSFDRLFPSQDTVPKGGFGNLIALPFQGQAQADGNSLFVDENYNQYEDQWAFLSTVPKITGRQLEALLAEQALSSLQPTAVNREPAPPGYTEELAVLDGSMLRIPKQGLPRELIADLRRIGTFPNPEFYKKQAMRLSVYGIPRVIDCTEADEKYLALPRGCRAELAEYLRERGIRNTWHDERNSGREIDVTFTGTLREEQAEAARKLLEHDTGVLAAATAFGKTVVAAYIMAQCRVNTLILVPSTALLEQWKGALTRFLDIRETTEVPPGLGCRRRLEVIGQLGGGRHTNAGIIDIAVMQSLLEGPEKKAKSLVGEYGLVICDECHHVPAVTFERVLRGVRARRIYGLSATPARADGLQKIIFMQCGPVRFDIDARQMAASQDFRRIMLPRFTRARVAPGTTIQDMHAALCANADRNELILRDAAELSAAGRTLMLLTSRREHAAFLAEELADRTEAQVFLLLGSDPVSARREKLRTLRAADPEEPLIIVSTNRYAGEGFDLPHLDTLLLTAPFSWKGTLAQNAGRLHRDYPGKKDVRIYDYVDLYVPAAERMFAKRRAEYTRQGYEIEPGLRESRACATYSGPQFLEPFAADLRAAAQEIYVCSNETDPGHLAELGALLAEQRKAGVNVRVRLGGSSTESSGEAMLQQLGIEAETDPAVTYSAAVIDRQIVWYGSMSLLGSTDGDLLRFESRDAAGEFLDLELNEAESGERWEQLSLDKRI